jgi:hypothetical protein
MTAAKYRLIVLLITLLGLLACSREDKAPVPEGAPPQGQQGAGSSLNNAAPGKLMIKIAPDSPTAMTDLQVVRDDGGRAAYSWSLNGRAIEGENTAMLSKGKFAKGDTVTVTVTGDGKEGTASVLIGNSPPKVTAVHYSPQYIYRGVDMTVTPEAIDLDGDYVRLNYRWSVNDVELQTNEPVLRGNAFRRGDKVTLKVIPYDSEGQGDPFMSKPFIIPNAPPRFISTPPTDFTGGAYVYHAAAEDPDGEALTYSLSAAPAGMSIDRTSGTVTWKINKEQAGTHTIEIVAQDHEGLKAFQKYSLAITIPGEVKQ